MPILDACFWRAPLLLAEEIGSANRSISLH
jgi:hypothetical protein